MTSSLAMLWVVGAALSGCASSGVEMTKAGQSAKKVTASSEAKLPDGRISYTVSPLDVLQVDVYPDKSHAKLHKADYSDGVQLQLYYAHGQYRIAPGDVLSIALSDDANKTYDAPVLPDGTIHLPRIGRVVHAVGITPERLAVILDREYASLLLRPDVIVSLSKSGLDSLQQLSAKYTVDSDGQIVLPLLGSFHVLGRNSAQISDMVFARAKKYYHNDINVAAAITPSSDQQANDQQASNFQSMGDGQNGSSANGQYYFHGKVRVSPDGSVFVPYAGSFAAQGKSLSALNQAMQSAYDRVYQNRVEVHVAVASSTNMSVYIGGAVGRPGTYPYQASQTLLQLIATAGWVNDGADISKTVLLHATADNRYVRYQTNLAEVVDGKAVLRQDIRLSPRDIVIVPKSGIENVDLWVDQYIRRLLPFNTSASVNYTAVKNGSPAALFK